jgi:hypothetical protein
MAFVSVPPFFGNIVYNLSNVVFYTELNAKLPIYSKMKVKGYMYPQMKKPVGMLINRVTNSNK